MGCEDRYLARTKGVAGFGQAELAGLQVTGVCVFLAIRWHPSGIQENAGWAS